MPTTLDPQDRAALRQILESRFSLEELKTLASDLGVDYNLLHHQTKSELSRELVDYFEHRGDLNRLVTAVQSQRPDAFPTRSIEIRFVVAAMLQHEAEKLISGNVLKDEELNQFNQFLNLFPQAEVDSWKKHYHETDRNKWKPHACANCPLSAPEPHACPDCAIDGIVEDVRKKISEHEISDIPLSLSFCSNDFFKEDDNLHIKTCTGLKTFRFVMIIDAISVFHPHIRDTLNQSQTQHNASIIVISPLNPDTHAAHHALEDAVRQYMKDAFARFDYHYDVSCEIGVENPISLTRWLVAELPKTARAIQDSILSGNTKAVSSYWEKQKGISGSPMNPASFSPK